MTNEELIVDAVRNAAKHAEHDYYRACEAQVVCVAKKALWDDFNPDDGVGFGSMNPYHPESLETGVQETFERYDAWRKAYDHAVFTFLGDRP